MAMVRRSSSRKTQWETERVVVEATQMAEAMMEEEVEGIMEWVMVLRAV